MASLQPAPTPHLLYYHILRDTTKILTKQQLGLNQPRVCEK